MLTAAGEVAPCAQHCSGMSAVAGPVTHCKEAALGSPPIWERFSSKLVLVKKENYVRVVKNCSKTMILLNLSNLSVATFARRSLRYICSRTSARASLICALTYSRTFWSIASSAIVRIVPRVLMSICVLMSVDFGGSSV